MVDRDANASRNMAYKAKCMLSDVPINPVFNMSAAQWKAEYRPNVQPPQPPDRRAIRPNVPPQQQQQQQGNRRNRPERPNRRNRRIRRIDGGAA